VEGWRFMGRQGLRDGSAGEKGVGKNALKKGAWGRVVFGKKERNKVKKKCKKKVNIYVAHIGQVWGLEQDGFRLIIRFLPLLLLLPNFFFFF